MMWQWIVILSWLCDVFYFYCLQISQACSWQLERTSINGQFWISNDNNNKRAHSQYIILSYCRIWYGYIIVYLQDAGSSLSQKLLSRTEKLSVQIRFQLMFPQKVPWYPHTPDIRGTPTDPPLSAALLNIILAAKSFLKILFWLCWITISDRRHIGSPGVSWSGTGSSDPFQNAE